MSAVIGAAHFRHGAGRLCLDFIRTLRFRGTPEVAEELADPEALRGWVEQFGPAFSSDAFGSGRFGSGAKPGAKGDAARVRQAQRLREAIVELIGAARGPGGASSCPAPARDLINRASAAPTPSPSLDAAGRLCWQAADPVSATLALVARDALDLVTSADLNRVRGCANPACSAVFFDGSRPGRRRWCSMDTCGNLAKKAVLRGKPEVKAAT